MSEQSAEASPIDSPDETYFPCPANAPAFAAVCGAIPALAAGLLYLPHLSGTLLHAFWVLVGVIILLPLMIPLLRRRPKGLTVSAEGIGEGRKLALWEEITRIRKGRFFPNSVVLVLGARRRSAFGKFIELTPPAIRLPGYEFVYRHVLPRVLKHRPDIPVSKHALRAMGDPGAARLPRWVGALFLVPAAAVAAIPLVARNAGFLEFFASVSAASILSNLAAIACALPETEGEHLAAKVGGSFGICVWLLSIHPFLDQPLFYIDVVAAVGVGLCLVTAVVLATRAGLGLVQKAVILLCVTGAGLAVYGLESRQGLDRSEIAELLGDGEFVGEFFWSADGNLAVADSLDRPHRQVLLDFVHSRSVELPNPSGQEAVWWVDRWSVVRSSSRREGERLYIYDISRGRDTLLWEADHFHQPRGPCVRGGDPVICWLTQDEERGEPAVKTYDVRSERTDTVDVDWPEGEDISWLYVSWLDRQTLGIVGHSAHEAPEGSGIRPAKALHVLRVGHPDGTTRHWRSSQRFRFWRASPDLQHAFARWRDGDDATGFYYVDLHTGRSLCLGGRDLPAWQRDSRAAFRIVGLEGDRWLAKFDVEKSEEKRVLSIPEGMVLASLSPQGRFAILMFQGQLPLYPLILVDVESGKRRRVLSSAFGSHFAPEPDFWYFKFPTECVFTPDETRFALQLVRFLPPLAPRTYLYSVPEEWLREE